MRPTHLAYMFSALTLIGSATRDHIIPHIPPPPDTVEGIPAPPCDAALVIGDTFLQPTVYENGPGITYIQVHGDETTGVPAAKRLINQYGGRLIQFPGNDRWLDFFHNEQEYRVDPNNIFSDRGRDATLRAWSFRYRASPPGEQQVVRAAVARFATTFLEQCAFSEASAIIALHNNPNEGQTTFHRYQRTARAAYRRGDVDNFTLVTTAGLFEYLRRKEVSVIHEDTEHARHGSLSWWAATHGIPYVNTEFQTGHLKEHARALESATEFFKE
ncbi:MAG: hypothetical protein OXR66_05875 [Candidatus Woesearchaeota archaeon]|nr:hypothetical protein [Candidatus Woesearchaeota archaeon]